MKNCEPLVSGPSLAIERTPGALVAEAAHEFVRERVAGAALAGAEGVAALYHEARHDAVEGEAVEERLSRVRPEGPLGQADEIRDGHRGLGELELAGDHALGVVISA